MLAEVEEEKMVIKRDGLIVLALALALAMPAAAAAQATAAPQVQQPPQGGVDWSGVGIGAVTMLADAAYVPAKFVYAALGGITGGASWALTGGNSQISDTIWRSSLGGDYVLTPSMIRGDTPIHFSGPTETPAAAGSPAAAAGSPAVAASASSAGATVGSSAVGTAANPAPATAGNSVAAASGSSGAAVSEGSAGAVNAGPAASASGGHGASVPLATTIVPAGSGSSEEPIDSGSGPVGGAAALGSSHDADIE